MATAGNSKAPSGENPSLGGELYQAAISLHKSIRRIGAKGDMMFEIGRLDAAHRVTLFELRSEMFELSEKIRHVMPDAFRIEAKGEMDTGGRSSKRSNAADLEELRHVASLMRTTKEAERKELLDLLAKEKGLFAGKAGNLPESIRKILLKFRNFVGDINSVFEAEQTRKEAAAVLTLGFRLQFFSKQIHELWQEMCKLQSLFSPENKDVMRTMIVLKNEYLPRICKLQWIAKRISMLQQVDPDFDSKVKLMMIQLKSESFLSAMEEVEREHICKSSMEEEERRFAAYRMNWDRIWGHDKDFEDQTLLSPMLYTHCTPRRIPIEALAGSTLQIYSIKISATKNLTLPVEVYGVVAARDTADRHRNPIFLRRSNYCQKLEENDSFLCLDGPVRAIVSMGTVYFEIQLKVKGASESEDKALISTYFFYNGDSSGGHVAKNDFCTVEFCWEQLRQSVQATILSVLVTSVDGKLPFPHGGRVVCSSQPQDGNEDIAGLSSRQVVLVDSEGGRMPIAEHGYLELSREVVSVELNGKLKVLIEAYSTTQSAESAQVILITPKKSNITKVACSLYAGGPKVEITVAWSLIPSKMLN
ncbi:uncharacterized protein [Aegilops tauschii subsp. strangulata]|nr:uncharacterized protein LOC109756986 [Aegilops tauschii subsp. strangulata]